MKTLKIHSRNLEDLPWGPDTWLVKPLRSVQCWISTRSYRKPCQSLIQYNSQLDPYTGSVTLTADNTSWLLLQDLREAARPAVILKTVERRPRLFPTHYFIIIFFTKTISSVLLQAQVQTALMEKSLFSWTKLRGIQLIFHSWWTQRGIKHNEGLTERFMNPNVFGG